MKENKSEDRLEKRTGKSLFKIISSIIIIILLLFGLCGLMLTEENQNIFFRFQSCFARLTGKSIEDEKSKDKILEELSYFETEIIEVANKTNNLKLNEIYVKTQIADKQEGEQSEGKESSKEESKSESSSEVVSETEKIKNEISKIKNNKDIDWDDIEKQTRIIYESWSIIAIDLNKYNINNEYIKNISGSLEKMLDNSIGKDSTKIISNVNDMYRELIKIYEQMNTDIEIEKIKLNLLNVYSKIQEDKYEEISENLNKISDNIKYLLENGERLNKNMISIKKSYILNNSFNNSNEENKKNNIFNDEGKKENIKKSYLYRYISIMKEVINI